MIAIDSNVARSIRQLERLQGACKAGLPEATDSAFWRPEVRRAAEAALEKLTMTEAERGFVANFLAQLEIVMSPRGIKFSLKPKGRIELNVMDAVNMEQMGDLMKFSNIEQARRVAELIRQFVIVRKRKRAIDSGKNADEIATGLFFILFGPRGADDKRAAATRKLLPHLQKFAQEQAAVLAPETIEKWLNAIFNAWVNLVRQKLPARVKRAMKLSWVRGGKEA